MRVLLLGFCYTRRLAKLAAGDKNPGNRTPHLCVYVKTWILHYFVIEYFSIEEMWLYCIMGRGRNRQRINQSERKIKYPRSKRKRNANDIFFCAKQRNKKIFVPEQAFDFMKNMNPQQLVDFLLPNDDDWHVKTSSGNASGS